MPTPAPNCAAFLVIDLTLTPEQACAPEELLRDLQAVADVMRHRAIARGVVAHGVSVRLSPVTSARMAAAIDRATALLEAGAARPAAPVSSDIADPDGAFDHLPDLPPLPVIPGA